MELYWYQSRAHDPVLGRFTSPDTLVPEPSDPQSLNRYAYVRNNPLSRIDPTGRYDLSTYEGRQAWRDDHPGWILGDDDHTGGLSAYNPATETVLYTAGVVFRYDEHGEGEQTAAQVVVPPRPIPQPVPVPENRDLLAAFAAFLAALLGAAAGTRTQSSPQRPEVQWVVRGGVASRENLEGAAARGTLTILGGVLFDMSVQTAPRTSVAQLASYLPHNQIGVTTYDRVRREGGTIVPNPTYDDNGVLDNPYHALLSNLSVDQTIRLFSPPQPNLWRLQRL